MIRSHRVLLACALLLGCAANGRELPPPACRSSRDCEAVAMNGASCVDQRCRYLGRVRGDVLLGVPRREGTLRIVAYRASAFDGPVGPRCDAKPVGKPLAIPNPSFPQAYEIESLPFGSVVVYAFVDTGDDDGEDLRAGRNDLVGVREASVALGEAKARGSEGELVNEVDVGIQWDTFQDPCD